MYFPTEILWEVGTYLSTADKSSCIRVCYAWYSPFLELLYTKVHIRSRHQFRQFYRSIQDSSDISDSIGNHVKELILNFGICSAWDDVNQHLVGITRDELESFPKYFKQLQVLDFDPRLWRYMRCSETFKQFQNIQQFPTLNRIPFFQLVLESFGSQLTHLSIRDEVFDHLISSDLMTALWTRIPNLEQLIIKGTNYNNLNARMLMAIGAQLPRLKHLTLSCVTLPLDERDMSSSTTFPLFKSAISLTLDDVHIKNWRMVTFLSLAFYHVQTLDFDMTFDWFYDDNVTIELYEQSMDACMGFAQLCIFLKKITFRKMNTSVFPFPYDAFFQEIATTHQDTVKVEMTEHAWWSTIDPASSFKAVTTQTGLLSKTSLKWSWTGKKKDISLFKSLSLCQHLRELELSCDVPLKNGLRLDLLLDHCQSLEELSVSETLVTTSRTLEKAGETKYRLKRLELKEAVLGDHLMDYIAEVCPKLEKLWIRDCVQEKPKKSSFIVIRMPEHNFKSIKLDSLHLNPGGPINKCETNIAILSFYESTRYASQDKRWKLRQQKTSNKVNHNNNQNENIPPAPEMWRFYHVHRSDISKTEAYNKQLRRLTTDEAAIIANFEMNEKKWKAVRNSGRRKQYQEMKLWEKDIQYGAVLLLCKSVKNLEFNELKI
ncbi:hypothetical protein G6F62_007962 [Rhizopus arrhizus]|nr:hypothetical protein G6F66_007204 [Rhizopus arrhizus]KAG1328845.1 hypothetical protein G6F62_007962 [Rhizopus arrhizus]KAG1376882.1 hypothetical protein G6F61_007215 [Rhizopus arrhizus]KAG1399356.1 hypothetical protein G6F60_007766 [Rhizopus arrhizus]